MRQPQDIVPIDNKEDLLLAIWHELVAIRAALAPPAPAEAAPAVPAVEVEPEPAPAAAPRRAPAKKKAATRRKKPR